VGSRGLRLALVIALVVGLSPRACRAEGPPSPPSIPTGWVDFAQKGVVKGWSLDPSAPEKPLSVQFFDRADGVKRLLGTALAGRARPDVNAALKVPGDHGFEWVAPAGAMRLHAFAAVPGSAPAELPVMLLNEPGPPNPRFRIGNDRAKTNAPDTFAELPDLPFRPSSWILFQHKKQSLIRPSEVRIDPDLPPDPALGRPRYAYLAPDGNSRVVVYDNPHGGFIYELYGRDGVYDAGGGADVFLLSDLVDEPWTAMDRRVDYSFEFKLKSAIWDGPIAERDSGTVYWQVISGFVLHFVQPVTGKRTNLFLQIYHANARGSTQTFVGALPVEGANYTGILSGDRLVRAPDPSGPLAPLTYNLNRYLCDAISRDYGRYRFPPEARDLANWRLKQFFVGVETQNRRADGVPKGTAAVAIQVAGISLQRQAAPSPMRCD
jgi:hypothetical protein